MLNLQCGILLKKKHFVQKCPKLAIPSNQECFDSYPIKFYHNVLNNNCEPCMSGCSLCLGLVHCFLLYNISDDGKGALWYEKIKLWIILIIVGIEIIGLAIWKLIIKKYFDKNNH